MREFQVGRNRGAAIARLRVQMVAALVAHLETGARPSPPLAGALIWRAFCILTESRIWRDGLPDPIHWADGVARLRLAGVVLFPHHVDIIEAMDAAWRKWAAVPEDQRARGALTGEMFDAMMG